MHALTHSAFAALTVAIGSIAILPSVARANIMIDDFTQRVDGNWPLVQNTSTGSGSNTIETGLSAIPGNTRGFFVRTASMGVSGLDNFTATVFNQSGASVFDYQSSAGASGDVELYYGDEFTNPLHLTGATGLAITFSAYDRVAAGPLEVDVDFSQQTSPNTGVGNSQSVQMLTSGAQTIIFPNVGPALTSVDMIQIDFVAPAGTDYRVDSISLVTVPEPASVGLLAFCVPMFLKRRR